VQFNRDPEAASSTLLAAIRQRCSKLGHEDSLVPATIWALFDSGHWEAMEARTGGRLDEARATAGRMMTIARRVVQEYPESADSYRVLSVAYNEIKKNALQTGDDRLVEEALVRAIEAAQRALGLDPDLILPPGYLERLTAQRAGIRAKRKAAGSATPRP
jgi:hypothetical protein